MRVEKIKLKPFSKNLQPLWSSENMVKNGTYRECDKEELIRKYNVAFTVGGAQDAM